MGNLRERKRRIFQPLKREYAGAVCIFSELDQNTNTCESVTIPWFHGSNFLGHLLFVWEVDSPANSLYLLS